MLFEFVNCFVILVITVKALILDGIFYVDVRLFVFVREMKNWIYLLRRSWQEQESSLQECFHIHSGFPSSLAQGYRLFKRLGGGEGKK